MYTIEYIEDNYRFVMIRCPYELMHLPIVREMFPKVIELKTTGYRKEYGNFVLPFDTTDFVASHLLLCEKGSAGQLTPVLGFKSVTLGKCDEHRISFPMLSLLDAPDPNNAYLETMKYILDDYRRRGLAHKIAYNGSFTVHPTLRENKILMKHFWDLSFSMLTNYYIDYKIDHVVAICATKFKIHEKKELHGWNYIQGEKGKLGPYISRAFFEANLVPMELKDIKEKSQVDSLKFRGMWDNRLILDIEHEDELKKAA